MIMPQKQNFIAFTGQFHRISGTRVQNSKDSFKLNIKILENQPENNYVRELTC